MGELAGRRRKLPRPHRCAATGKYRWPDSKAAVDFLHGAKNALKRAQIEGADSRRREVRHYKCPSCKGFHTTSLPVARAA